MCRTIMSLRLSEFRKHFTISNTIAQKIECYVSKYKLIPCNPFREIKQSIILGHPMLSTHYLMVLSSAWPQRLARLETFSKYDATSKTT